MKNKDQDEINREAQMLTQAAEPADADLAEAEAMLKAAVPAERPSQLFYRVVK